ncbi:hypothetical protein HPP92_029004 [Vanilla planifolia]|uniref:Uncharacterized protein n=1 Tax=Vanilla planifolia TaxID=51239 RepID=A0A835U371_VANPL|nr:hypothetical protein HPP92_029004 [Vanilla planifolia]KAG0446110.1 hypothetical protein HPP92_028992 [Vanilla planifolia]
MVARRKLSVVVGGFFMSLWLNTGWVDASWPDPSSAPSPAQQKTHLSRTRNQKRLTYLLTPSSIHVISETSSPPSHRKAEAHPGSLPDRGHEVRHCLAFIPPSELRPHVAQKLPHDRNPATIEACWPDLVGCRGPYASGSLWCSRTADLSRGPRRALLRTSRRWAESPDPTRRIPRIGDQDV